MATRLLVALVAAALAAGCGDDPAPEAPPRPFVGIYADDVFFRDADYRRRTLERQHSAGIRLIRQPFAWSEFEAQPERFDEFVGAAASAGIQVLPVLLGPAPGVERGERGMQPPRSPAAYARFAADVVRRFGSEGSYWEENPDVPKLPIRSWQVWNEPNIPSFWASGPDPAEYAELLRAASAAIRAADADAEVVAAGLPDSRLGLPAREFLRGIYRAGAGDALDVVAVHPYSATPAELLAKVRSVREIVEGDARMWVTEFGWGTGGRAGRLTVDRATQARYVAETFRRLHAERAALRLRGAVYFQWRDPDPFPGRRPIWPFFAGLVEADGEAKPALAALERAAAQLNG